MLNNLNTKDKQGIYIISAVVLIFVAIIAMNFYMNSNLPGSNHCKANYEGRSHHTIIFDKTDDFSEGQITALTNYFNNRIQTKYEANSGIKIQDMITVYILDKDNIDNYTQAVPIPFFRICNPGNDPNPLNQNPKFIKQNFESFKEEFSKLFEKLKEKGEAEQSPIFEMIRASSLHLPYNSTNHIYIVSDLIHHTNHYSQYREVHSFEEFKDDNQHYYNRLKPSLSGASVDLFYINRNNYSQSETVRHEEFWKNYFMDNMVESINFTRL